VPHGRARVTTLHPYLLDVNGVCNRLPRDTEFKHFRAVQGSEFPVSSRRYLGVLELNAFIAREILFLEIVGPASIYELRLDVGVAKIVTPSRGYLVLCVTGKLKTVKKKKKNEKKSKRK